MSAYAAIVAWQQGTGTAEDAIARLAPVAAEAADYSNLGVLHRACGRLPAAEAAHRRAIALDPSFVPAHYNLGNLLADAGHPAEAALAYRRAVALQPDHGEAWNGLGLVLQRQGELAEAVSAFTHAVARRPAWAEALVNLGVVLLGVDRFDDAAQALRRAAELNPTHAGAFGNLAAVYLRAGHPMAAEAASRTAIALAPNEHRWIVNLAVALQHQGRHRETETLYRQALALRPDYPSGHGNLLFALNYRHDLTDEAIFAEYRRWDEIHAKPLRQPPADWPSPVRLRIGYVSPDFRQHAVALFAEPLLAAHDRSQIEIFCYAELATEDEVTARFRALADCWRPTLGMSDAQLAETIRGDKIDVLVDLGGHTAASRILALARKPAPVQIAWLLGHGYTTGLSAMDAFLTDDRLTPTGSDPLFSERLERLPRIPLVYAPPADMAPVADLPALTNGFITFGHFGRPERLNETVVEAWARILLAVPGSRLTLNNRGFQEPAFRALWLARFVDRGIAAERLDLIFTSPQPATWAAYGSIDIALDPFPHNAGTTTIEALWQGVPVVTLAGRPSVGRFGASILHAVGLDDWVAHDIDAYVALAVAAASDAAALAEQRRGLRARFAASPLRDAAGLARCMEAVYRRLRDAPDTQRMQRLYGAGDIAGARALAEAILARRPRDGVAAHVLGLAAFKERRLPEADAAMRIASAASPDDPEIHANHAAILRSLGRLAEAEQAARIALKAAPHRVETLNNLANILRDRGAYDASIAAYRAALSHAPRFADAWANLAWVQALTGAVHEAEHSARQAIASDPANANGHNNLGLALMRQSRLLEAEETLRRAVAIRPDFALAHSNILFCLNYRDDLSAETIFSEYRAWDRRHAAPLLPPAPTSATDRDPNRRLRVGYVSPDFRQHAVALFAEPLLQAHDKRKIEIFCYAEVTIEDDVTRRIKTLADHWRSTVGMDDAMVADTIRQDRIDVLVDLAGHTAGNRLLAFARKPAPVQVEFMLGHGYTSGLSAMDAFMADDALAPPEADALFSERLVRLPRIPLAYRPPEDMPPVSSLPALAAGYVTFGYFGRTVRLNDGVIAVWARILRAVPGTRLMLNSSPFAETAGRTEMAARFAAHGIPADRLIMVCTAPQPKTWAAYGEIDIALDPFPHNAGTTTIEALWQGVPVLTMAGRPTVGRIGAAILHAVGLDDWSTLDAEAYVARAVAAASDIDALADLRAALRGRFAASPLFDPVGLARAIENAYRSLHDAACQC